MLSAWLNWYSIDARPIEIEIFSVSKFLTNSFFHASFMFRIHMHCIVFYIHLVVLQSYISLFSYITCIHFAKLGTQLDLKIDWLIFESFVHFSIYYFSWCVKCWKLRIFFWDIMDNNLQIFSLLDLSSKDHLFMGHIASSLHVLK